MHNHRYIHLAIAFDQHFIIPFHVLVTSILENNKASFVTIHAIATGVDEETKNEIIKYVRANNAEIIFYQFTAESISNFPRNLSHVTLATYYRLFLVQLIPDDVSTLLYLDTDTIVIGDLHSLYTTNLERTPLAAVADTAVPTRPELGIHEPGQYFNAGVLLINVSEWKKQKVTERAIHVLTTQSEKMRFVDQDALNATLINNWIKLDKKYNLTLADVPGISNLELVDYVKDKVIIHYTTVEKPWKKICANRLKFLYMNTLSRLTHLSQEKEGFKLNYNNIYIYTKINFINLYFNYPFMMKFWRKINNLI